MIEHLSPEDLIIRARIHMLTRKGFSFFGTLALHMPLTMTTTEIPTAATDGKIQIYNEDFVKELAKENPNQLIGIVAHEVCHAALGHIPRMQGRIRSLWNIATDISINNMLLECGIPMPKDCLKDDKYIGMSSEDIYADLYKKDPPQNCPSMSGASGEAKESGDGASESSNGEPDESEGATGTQGPREQSWGDHGKWNEMSPDEMKAMEKEWKKRLSQAATIARQKGDIPGAVKDLVNDILHPKLDYRQALAAYIQPQMVDYTFEPPDPRYPDNDFLLPDFGGEGLEDLVIAIDTSGSCIQDLPQFLTETREVLAAWTCFRIHYVQCDASIQSWKEISSFDNIPNTVSGYGGTSFLPVFDEIQKRGIQPSVLIYFTDTMGDFPSNPPSYPILWVSNYKEAKVPFGTLAYITN